MAEITVTVDEDHLPALAGVVADLRARGMQVSQVLDELGIVTGAVPDSARASLSAVAGVASVDAQLQHQLPPPDSPVQ